MIIQNRINEAQRIVQFYHFFSDEAQTSQR